MAMTRWFTRGAPAERLDPPATMLPDAETPPFPSVETQSFVASVT
jgi:hypothetical protein